MSSDKSDFKGIGEKLEQLFKNYYATGGAYANMRAELMNVNRDTDEMFMDTVYITLLNATAFEVLNQILPLLHKPEMRAILVDVMQETLDRLEGQEDEPGRTTEED